MNSRSVLALLSIAFGIAVFLAAITSVKYPPSNDYDRAALTRHVRHSALDAKWPLNFAQRRLTFDRDRIRLKSSPV